MITPSALQARFNFLLSLSAPNGKGGVGATNAPSLAGPKFLQMTTGSFEEIVATIVSGVPKEKIKDPTHPNAMGARGGRMALTDPQIQSVAAYVWTLSHK